MFLLLLLLSWSSADANLHKTFNPGDVHRTCISNNTYDHYYEPCAKLGPVECRGMESSLWDYDWMWECQFHEPPGYIVRTEVLEDATLRVHMTARRDVHPVTDVAEQLFNFGIRVFFFYKFPMLATGIALGRWTVGSHDSGRSKDMNWVRRSDVYTHPTPI